MDKRIEMMKPLVLMKILLIFGFLLLNSCSVEVAEESAIPVVNDENCQQSNLEKIKNKAVQMELAGLCIRRGDLAHSKIIAW